MAKPLFWRGAGVLSIGDSIIYPDDEIPAGALEASRITQLKKAGSISERSEAQEKAADRTKAKREKATADKAAAKTEDGKAGPT